MGYGKEYNRWVRENPEKKRVEPEKDLGMKDNGGNVEKLKSMKDTLVEILSAGDLKIEEKKLLKEIRELIKIE